MNDTSGGQSLAGRQIPVLSTTTSPNRGSGSAPCPHLSNLSVQTLAKRRKTGFTDLLLFFLSVLEHSRALIDVIQPKLIYHLFLVSL